MYLQNGYIFLQKNSKVDIIQAVGRALKKSAPSVLIVVPIYHSNNDEVENSISQGSFKNLLSSDSFIMYSR